MNEVGTIRETPFGNCLGAKIPDITTGDFGEEDANRVYFHLDNGQTFFATIGDENSSGLMGFIVMDSDEDKEDRL